MTVLVFANGDLPETEWIRPYLAEADGVIAADGGAQHVLALDTRPGLIIGDLDSFPAGQRERLEQAGTRFLTHPPAKDETDLELAVAYAAEHYDGEILVFGAFGGRLDQMLANILLLLHPALRTRPVRYLTPHQRLWMVWDETEIAGTAGDTVSLIPLGGDVRVAATTGLRWPLHDDVLHVGPARGVSNEMTADTATVTVQSGYLLCVHTTQTWQR